MLPAGNGGADALSIKDPTPTFLPEELSCIETRHVTGVVPSGNSNGNSTMIIQRENVNILELENVVQHFNFKMIRSIPPPS